MHSHTSDLSLFAHGLANRVAATFFFSLLILSLSLSSYLFPPSFQSLLFFSLRFFPFRLFSFFFFLSFKISRRSPNGGRDWPARKTRIKRRTGTRVGTRNRGGERRLAHLAGHCESHTECWIGGPERNERGGRHTSPREQQRAAIRHSHRKTRSIFASPLLSPPPLFFFSFLFFNFACCSSESASFQPGFFRPLVAAPWIFSTRIDALLIILLRSICIERMEIGIGEGCEYR